MIKWLKELVKGSDFVVTKKKISVIALDPRAGKSYGEDIAGLFSDVAVSYTHLDVYKRQTLSTWRSHGRAIGTTAC